MHKPYFYVDFNEMVDANTVLLSAGDSKVDARGVTVQLREGMLVSVYMDDLDENGNVDNLVANGVVTKNTEAGWAAHVKWCCRIDSDGIRPQSGITRSV
jgi:lysophospholipase L1-like esterase